MSGPDLNLIIALDALLQEGSVASAARRLGLSASAMSRTLTRLRAATGDALLVRAGSRMVLTPHAEHLRERTRQTVEATQTLLKPAPAKLDLAAVCRTFTIRANEAFVEAFAASLIGAVGEVAPRVRLRFAPKPEKSARPLREGLVDLEIGVLGESGPEVRVQALFRDHFVGAVRKGHALELQGEITPGHYAACGHVVASRRGRTQGPVDDALAELGLERRIIAVVPNFPAALAVARSSDLVALVPASFVDVSQTRARGAPDTIHTFALPVQTERITVSLMWHPRFDADPLHRRLRQLVASTCRRRFDG